MLDMIFLMIAAAASSGGGGGSDPAIASAPATAAPAVVAEAPLQEATQEATQEAVQEAETEPAAEPPVNDAATEPATTAFLSPSKGKDSATQRAAPANDTATTAFLAPQQAPATTAFLAPKQEAQPATPAAPATAFLAPAAQPPAAAPMFLAPQSNQTAAAPAPAFLAPSAPSGLVAEPQIPTGRFTTATEVKPILNATKANWIHVREFDGKDLLYVTHLWSWRCGLLQMRVGINGNTPEIWPLPPCHLDQQSPAAILEGDGLPYAEFGLGAVALIEIQITYDDLSTDSAKFNRNGMLVP